MKTVLQIWPGEEDQDQRSTESLTTKQPVAARIGLHIRGLYPLDFWESDHRAFVWNVERMFESIVAENTGEAGRQQR